MEFAFGDRVLDVERRELRRGGEPIALQPQVFDLLVYLVQNRDRVVTKDDLVRTVWGGRIVSDSTLTSRINAVRRAVGDDGGAQRLIRTVARKGIRFVGALRGEQISPRLLLDSPEKPSLAVLPFNNMTGDVGQDYFVDGVVVEEITTAISRLPWLFVVARNSSFTFKGRAVGVKDVARALGVRYVLEGSVRKAGSRVRIAGQLIDTASGAHIWADRFDGSLEDVFALQDRVAAGVVGAIEPKLRLAEIERASRQPIESIDAYDLYLRALGQYYKFTGESLQDAVALLDRALAIDPAYALAAALAARSRGFLRSRGWGMLSDREIAETVRFAKQAIETGKHDPDALWMAGLAIGVFAGELMGAVDAIERALTLNSNSAQAWMAKGWTDTWLDRPDPAVDAFERAMRLSPLDPLEYLFAGGMAQAHLVAGRCEEAMDWVDRWLRNQPGYLPSVRIRLALCGHFGRIEEARRRLGALIEAHPELTIAKFAAICTPALPPRVTEFLSEGLGKAGMRQE